jgi:hypothetical protein
MDPIRKISLASVAQFVVLSAISPAIADTADEESKHQRHHAHGQVHAVSYSRGDYPVIWNWISTPDQANDSDSPT